MDSLYCYRAWTLAAWACPLESLKLHLTYTLLAAMMTVPPGPAQSSTQC